MEKSFADQIKIEKVNIRGYWNWKTHNDKCAICRNYIFEQSLNTNECTDSYSVIGVCGHAYHHECISNWLQTRNVCPLCNQKWQYLEKK